MEAVKICGIYMITSPSNKIYIGQAINIHSRWLHYRRLSCDRQPKLYASFKKYGVENHKFEIIEACNPEQLNEKEIYYIKLYNTFNSPIGLNLQSGGHNGSPDEETRIKMSKSSTGRRHTDSAKEKNRIAHLNKKQSPETVEKRASKLRGRKQSKEHIANRVKIAIGKKRSEESRNRIRAGRANQRKIIIQFNKDTHQIIKVFQSINDAARELNVFASGISGCLRGEVKSAYGYIWRYENDPYIIEDGIDTIDKMKLSWKKRKEDPEWNSIEQKEKRRDVASIRSKKMWKKRKESAEWIKKEEEEGNIEIKRKEEINSPDRKSYRREIAKVRARKMWDKLRESPDKILAAKEKAKITWKNKKENKEWDSDDAKKTRRAISDNANMAKEEIRMERLMMVF